MGFLLPATVSEKSQLPRKLYPAGGVAPGTKKTGDPLTRPSPTGFTVAVKEKANLVLDGHFTYTTAPSGKLMVTGYIKNIGLGSAWTWSLSVYAYSDPNGTTLIDTTGTYSVSNSVLGPG